MQAIFCCWKNGSFLFQEYTFSLREHYPLLQNFEVRTLVHPLISNFLLPTPFNPKSLKIAPPPFCKGRWRYDRRSKRYKYRIWKGGSICLESSAESREYMLTYLFGEWEYIFVGGWKHIFIGGDGSKSLGGASPWICTPGTQDAHFSNNKAVIWQLYIVYA